MWILTVKISSGPKNHGGSVHFLMPGGVRDQKRSAVPSSTIRRIVRPSAAQQRTASRRLTAFSTTRRAAHLAETAEPRESEAAMTSVSYPRSLANRAINAQHSRRIVRQRARRVRSSGESDHLSVQRLQLDRQQTPLPTIEHGEPMQNTYGLRITAAPSSRGQAGQALSAGLSLQVTSSAQSANAARAELDYGRLFAVASLVDSSTSTQSNHATVSTQRTQGLVQSITPSISEADGNESEPQAGIVGNISFPDLVISNAGTFRIRVTLMRMGSSNEESYGGMSMATIETEDLVINL